jgi:hypothetical protein
VVAHSSHFVYIYQDDQLVWKHCFQADTGAAAENASAQLPASPPSMKLACTQRGFVVVAPDAQVWIGSIMPRARCAALWKHIVTLCLTLHRNIHGGNLNARDAALSGGSNLARR